MKCDKIKELILTDYVDGCLSANDKEQMEAHLKTCAACHEFEQTVQQQLVAPFDNLETRDTPEAVWHNIKATISPEEERISTFEAVVRFLGSLQGLRQTAFLMACVVVIFGLTFMIMNRDTPSQQWAQQDTRNEQQLVQESLPEADQNGLESELAYISDDYEEVYDMLEEGYGTALEEYFL